MTQYREKNQIGKKKALGGGGKFDKSAFKAAVSWGGREHPRRKEEILGQLGEISGVGYRMKHQTPRGANRKIGNRLWGRGRKGP